MSIDGSRRAVNFTLTSCDVRAIRSMPGAFDEQERSLEPPGREQVFYEGECAMTDTYPSKL